MTYTRAERDRRKATVNAWVAVHGYWCPGWAVPSHIAADLEACHVRPRFSGGESGPLTVMCHACNVRQRYQPNRKV